MLNVLTIIPARGGSKKLKNKNIKLFNGKPLIYWTIKQAQKSKYGNNIYVTSDSKKILEISKKLKCNIIKRPSKISDDNSSSEDAIKHLINSIKFNKKIDYIIFLQCTSPLRSYKDIDKAMKIIIKEKTNSLISMVEFEDLTMWIEGKENVIPYNYNPLQRKPRQKEGNYLIENGSIYIFKPKVLSTQNNRVDLSSLSIYKMNKLKLIEIDDISDFKYSEKIFSKLQRDL